jgi:DNA-binding transcriptional ArsR family regulator
MRRSVSLRQRTHFDYDHIMIAEHADTAVARIAAAIAEPARARMLCCLMDGHARTSTELSVVAEVTPSTASAHLNKLKDQQLVKVLAQGKHRYYSLADKQVASALEALMNVAGAQRERFVPNTPTRLRAARTCYDHMAGTLAVALHDRLFDLGWLVQDRAEDSRYDLSDVGLQALTGMGVEVDDARGSRRRFACACVDWSERRPHLGGALGAALLSLSLKERWVTRDLDSRALAITPKGEREMRQRFGFA